MIIKTPESMIFEKASALERIDKYLLILVTFKNGLAFGVKFNERQSKPGQWLMGINANTIVGGIGDLHNFESTMLMLSDFCQNWDGLLGENYLTGYGIKNFLASYLQKEFEKNASALAVNFIVVDWRNKNDPFLWFINFDGRIKQLKCFAVAGGSEYEESLTKEGLEKLTPEEKAIFDIQKERLEKAGMPKEFPLTLNRLRYPRKDAIAYLEKNWKPDMKKDDAVNLLKKTLFECNPESHDKMIEIAVIIPGKEPETLYFKKDKKVNKNKK